MDSQTQKPGNQNTVSANKIETNKQADVSEDNVQFRHEVQSILREYDLEPNQEAEILNQACKSGKLEIPISQYIYIQKSTKVQAIEIDDFTPKFNNLEELMQII